MRNIARPVSKILESKTSIECPNWTTLSIKKNHGEKQIIYCKALYLHYSFGAEEQEVNGASQIRILTKAN